MSVCWMLGLSLGALVDIVDSKVCMYVHMCDLVCVCVLKMCGKKIIIIIIMIYDKYINYY